MKTDFKGKLSYITAEDNKRGSESVGLRKIQRHCGIQCGRISNGGLKVLVMSDHRVLFYVRVRKLSARRSVLCVSSKFNKQTTWPHAASVSPTFSACIYFSVTAAAKTAAKSPREQVS